MTETYSPYVYYIVKQALALAVHSVNLEPRVGDVVVEFSHVLGTAQRRVGRTAAFGTLVGIECDDMDVIYTIKSLEGETTRWRNAEILVVYRNETKGSRDGQEQDPVPD